MRYTIDHDYHLHSMLSSCSSDPAQTTHALLAYAEENGLKQICLTDHYWDSAVSGASSWYQKQNFEHIAKALPLPQGRECSFLFGCETDMDRFLTVGIPAERFAAFDFIIVPTTHLHMKNFTYQPQEDTVEGKTRLYIKRFEAFLNADLPFQKVGLAHLTCRLIMRENDQYLDVLDAVSDAHFEMLFKQCAQCGCGIELNIDWEQLTQEQRRMSLLRPYIIAREQGCRFYLGSDAHHNTDLDRARKRFEKTIELLALTEEDKFHIG